MCACLGCAHHHLAVSLVFLFVLNIYYSGDHDDHWHGVNTRDLPTVLLCFLIATLVNSDTDRSNSTRYVRFFIDEAGHFVQQGEALYVKQRFSLSLLHWMTAFPPRQK
jgi:hypothetical protein